VSASLRQIPNLITILRILLIAPIAIALSHEQLLTSLLLIGVAALSDAADGFLAKQFGWQTELGALLDPLADKLLLVTIFVTLATLGGVPIWLMAAAVGRDCIIVLGALAYRRFIGTVRMEPTLISKINTLCQLAFVVSVVARQEFTLPASWIVTLLGALVLLTVAISGLDYVITFAERAISISRTRRTSAAGQSNPP
jgi:cardiolipin synthase (CMP-forming)